MGPAQSTNTNHQNSGVNFHPSASSHSVIKTGNIHTGSNSHSYSSHAKGGSATISGHAEGEVGEKEVGVGVEGSLHFSGGSAGGSSGGSSKHGTSHGGSHTSGGHPKGGHSGGHSGGHHGGHKLLDLVFIPRQVVLLV